MSGGLDSAVALHLMKEQDIELEAVHFTSHFCTCGGKGGGCGPASKIAESAGIKLHIVNKGEDYLEVIKKPKHGRGSNMNACIDCRIYSFRKAKELYHEVHEGHEGLKSLRFFFVVQVLIFEFGN